MTLGPFEIGLGRGVQHFRVSGRAAEVASNESSRATLSALKGI